MSRVQGPGEESAPLNPGTREASSLPAPARHGMWSIIRTPKFLALTISQSISQFGDKLDYMALLAMIGGLAATNHWEPARANSFLLVIAALPTIIFGPLVGVLVDRWNRRRVMIVCDSLRALLVLSVPLVALKTGNLTLVFGIAFIVFLLGLFFNTARLSIIPNLVESGTLLEANSVIGLIGRGATFLGMLLGGLIVDWSFWTRIGIRPAWTAGFYIDALTFLVSAVTVYFVTFTTVSKTSARPLPLAELVALTESRLRSVYTAVRQRIMFVVHDFTEAFVLIRGTPALRLVMTSVTMFVVLGAAIIVLFIPIVQTARDDTGLTLGAGTKGVGFIGAVGAVGLVISSLVYGLIGRRFRKRNIMLTSFIILGLLTVVIASSESMLVALILAFVAGIFLAPVYIAQDTLIHESVPEEARGRVFSTREWFLNLAAAVAAFIIGQVVSLLPRWMDALQLPLGIALDHRRLLLALIGIAVAVASIVTFVRTRKQAIG